MLVAKPFQQSTLPSLSHHGGASTLSGPCWNLLDGNTMWRPAGKPAAPFGTYQVTLLAAMTELNPVAARPCSSERLTGALLDGVTHHAHIVEMNAESYCLKQSRTRKMAIGRLSLTLPPHACPVDPEVPSTRTPPRWHIFSPPLTVNSGYRTQMVGIESSP